MSKIKTTNITRFGIEVSPIVCLYPFPDVAALMDLLYISRSSAVRPTLQTPAPIQSYTSFSQDIFGCPLFLWHFTFTSGINFSSVRGLVQNKLLFAF